MIYLKSHVNKNNFKTNLTKVDIIITATGLTVVKGCNVLVNIWAVHRNPEYWGEDAEQFRPERFLNHNPKHPAAFMPFSYGSRGCIGKKNKLPAITTTHRLHMC